MTIVELTTRPKEINAECIEILEKFLADAKEGRIVGVAIAAVAPDLSSYHQSSSTDSFQVLLAAVAILQHRMLVDQRQAMKDSD